MRKYSERYMTFIKKIGKNIETIRVDKGYSVEQLAQKTGFSKKLYI